MARQGLAAHQKKARRWGAYLVLIDESGLLMAPLLRRSWALRGHPSEIFQQGGEREKVSIAAAMWLSPCRDRLGLLFRTLPNAYFNNQQVATFLEDLLSTLRGRVVVIWDGGPMHKGDPIRDALRCHPRELSLERLPPYAPILNPVENVWAWLKYDRLENFAPKCVSDLEAAATAELSKIYEDQHFLQALWHGSDLPLPRRTLLC